MEDDVPTDAGTIAGWMTVSGHMAGDHFTLKASAVK